MAQFQTTPSVSGSSAEFFIAGSGYMDDLFWNSLGANANASHFISDFQVMTDSAAPTSAEALEFDLVQVVNGLKYNWSSECHYTTKKWDIWDEASQQWVPSNATCTPFTPGTWHHVIWEVERVGNQTHYLSITVDGVTQTISSSLAYQAAPATSWSACVVMQVQQDLSSNPGTGFHEWVDQANVYEW